MGTRNVTAVVKDGKYVIAQYGQWDGYISHSGIRLLKFLENKNNVEKLKERLKDCTFITDEEYNKILEEQCGVAPDAFGISLEQCAKRDEILPFVSRDIGCDILQQIIDTEGPVVLQNSIHFVNDSLFCEWAYVIDLDKNTYEIYEGFQQEPLKETERFYKTEPDERDYYPVKLIKEYKLNDLPSEEALLEFEESLEA